eukprot:CAMPEP_0198295170 /NCGR_PEP_ID=MMETSP1449-20131203/26285_1 /TAXON_ID=420275 /ORGANISM="Attheya septentrionalis, Strain CCMP2084" /LENGTH=52 /DNA_ID=CAMNT_0043995383 /DNA_START=194 /DNA_END=349 /DNA_ORIENTATION=-
MSQNQSNCNSMEDRGRSCRLVHGIMNASLLDLASSDLRKQTHPSNRLGRERR